MKTIIEMAREAGWSVWFEEGEQEFLERFAALVRAEAQAEEREACAIDGGLACRYFEDSERVKSAIRARGNT